jgi:hypothetical protein
MRKNWGKGAQEIEKEVWENSRAWWSILKYF